MNVILDTNIWISFLMGKRLHNVADIFERSDVQVYVSKELINELVVVLSRPKVSKYISTESVEAMWTLMREKCYAIEEYPVADADIRDPKDVYLLSMADAIPADFIVTGDYDLLTLGKYNRTPILSFSDFIQVLSGLS